MQQEKIISIKVEVLALDSTSCKVHSDGHGCLKNMESSLSENQKADGTLSFTWYPQMTRQSLKFIYPEEINTTLRKVDLQSKK